jgi:hypothetical protein
MERPTSCSTNLTEVPPPQKVFIARRKPFTNDITGEFTPGAEAFEDDHLVYPVPEEMVIDPSVDVHHEHKTNVHGEITSPAFRHGLRCGAVTGSTELNELNLQISAIPLPTKKSLRFEGLASG